MRNTSKMTMGLLAIVVSSMFLVTAFSGTVGAKAKTPIEDGPPPLPGDGLIAKRGDGWVNIGLSNENFPGKSDTPRIVEGTIKFTGAKVIGFQNSLGTPMEFPVDYIRFTVGGNIVEFGMAVQPHADAFRLYLEYEPGSSQTDNGEDTPEAGGHDHGSDGVHDDNGRTGNNGAGKAPAGNSGGGGGSNAMAKMTITFSYTENCPATTFVGSSATPYADRVPIPLME
ncbi:MAG: hypothetical protein JSV56_13950 [Methanomassiliicoccales archaeon]|nr:MAG: hypothetical protein JSV56_13950 [Methanomassiliicoccales archaeon]